MSQGDDVAELLQAVPEFLDQINGAGFRDAHAHPIETNQAHLELLAILTARGISTSRNEAPLG